MFQFIFIAYLTPLQAACLPQPLKTAFLVPLLLKYETSFFRYFVLTFLQITAVMNWGDPDQNPSYPFPTQIPANSNPTDALYLFKDDLGPDFMDYSGISHSVSDFAYAGAYQQNNQLLFIS